MQPSPPLAASRWTKARCVERAIWVGAAGQPNACAHTSNGHRPDPAYPSARLPCLVPLGQQSFCVSLYFAQAGVTRDGRDFVHGAPGFCESRAA